MGNKYIVMALASLLLMSCFAGLSTATIDDSDSILVNQPPVADAGDSQITKRLVTFNGSGSSDPDGVITNYTWTFTYDSNPQTLWNSTPSFDFNITGIYEVMLRVEDNSSLADFDNITLFVTILPPIANAGSNQDGVRGVYVLDGSNSIDPDGAIMNYTWSFVYNGSSNELWKVNPSFDFNKSGNYEITLNVTDDDYRYDESTTWVNISNQLPVANAGTDMITKRLVTLNGSASNDPDGIISNYTWSFTYNGSQQTLYDETPSFDFNASGIYEITLNVTDDENLTDEDTVNIIVSITEPVANAGADQSGYKGLYWLIGSDSTDSDSSTLNCTWSFIYNGDLINLFGTTRHYYFNLSGNYEVNLTVRDDDWRYDVDTIWVNVSNQIPIADAGVSQNTKRLVIFNGSNSTDSDGIITNYTWSFTYDDLPQKLWGLYPIFDFNINGIYEVTLVVTDNDGVFDADKVTMAISISPPVASAGADQSGYSGFYILNGSGSNDTDGSIVNYKWTFNDGGVKILNGLYPQYDFQNVGVYDITLTVMDDDGRTSESTVTITIIERIYPVANAGADQTVNGMTIFDGSGSSLQEGEIANYTWTFNDNGNDVLLHGLYPHYTFETEGTYNVTLEVTSEGGFTDSDIVSITIDHSVADTSDGSEDGDGSGESQKDNTDKMYLILLIILIVIGIIALLIYKQNKDLEVNDHP